MLISNSCVDFLNVAISYIIASELDNEVKLQMIKNLISLSRKHKFMDYEGLKHLKDHVKKRIKELQSR